MERVQLQGRAGSPQIRRESRVGNIGSDTKAACAVKRQLGLAEAQAGESPASAAHVSTWRKWGEGSRRRRREGRTGESPRGQIASSFLGSRGFPRKWGELCREPSTGGGGQRGGSLPGGRAPHSGRGGSCQQSGSAGVERVFASAVWEAGRAGRGLGALPPTFRPFFQEVPPTSRGRACSPGLRWHL